MDLKAERFDCSPVAEVFAFIKDISKVGAALALNAGQIIEILAKHGCYQLYAGQFRHGVITDKFSVSHNRYSVADGIHLFQKVCDKYNADAFVPQISHHAEQFFNFIIIQRRRRLIQDQNLCIHIDGSRNGDHLLDGNGIIFKCFGNIDLNLQFLHQLLAILFILRQSMV